MKQSFELLFFSCCFLYSCFPSFSSTRTVAADWFLKWLWSCNVFISLRLWPVILLKLHRKYFQYKWRWTAKITPFLFAWLCVIACWWSISCSRKNNLKTNIHLKWTQSTLRTTGMSEVDFQELLLRIVRSAQSLEIHWQVPLSHIRTPANSILSPVAQYLNTKPLTKQLNSPPSLSLSLLLYFSRQPFSVLLVFGNDRF